MRKGWLYRGGGGDSGGGIPTKTGRSGGGRAVTEAATPGCMCAVFQLFDLHHFQFALHHPPPFKPGDSFLQDNESTVLKGVEAPRNSLELEETNFTEAASLSSTVIMKEEENLYIPIGVQIKTTVETRSPRSSTSSSKAKASDDVFSERNCSSGSLSGNKTPNVVARLMGLDLLPGSGSPSLLSSSRRHSTSNSLTNSHMHPQGQTQKQQHPARSSQFLQSRSTSCIVRSSFFDTDSTTGTLSLPETPRISSARRSDVDHRLSLQINKDNIAEEFEPSAALTLRKMGRRREIKASEDENRSPGHYARHIVKQVRESASRRVGHDITNTIKSREQRRDDRVILLKPKKPSTLLTRVNDDSSPGKQSTTSSSPRLRVLDPKNKPAATVPVTKNQFSNSPRLFVPLSPTLENQTQLHQANKIFVKLKPQLQEQQKDDKKSNQKCKKAGTERYNSRHRKPPQASDAIRNKKEELFIRSTSTKKADVSEKKKSKKTQLSNGLFNISVPTLLQVKKDPLPRTELQELHKQRSQASDAVSRERRSTQLSSCSSRSYKKEEARTLGFQENIKDRCNGISTSVDEVEYQYIQRILKRTGIDEATPVSQAKWFSPSHPLDPSIFHYIELFHPATNTVKASKLSQRWSRKLIFQLVDELLVEILKPYINLKPWIIPSSAFAHASPQMNGSQLIDTLCARIGNFTAANCQVLEDIDALIDKDLRESEHAYYQEEGERIVSYIEREILESLVHETMGSSSYSATLGEQDLTEVTWRFIFT